MRIGFKIAAVIGVAALALILSLPKATVTAPAAQVNGGITPAWLDQKALEYQHQAAQFGQGYPDALGSNVVVAAGSSTAATASAESYC